MRCKRYFLRSKAPRRLSHYPLPASPCKQREERSRWLLPCRKNTAKPSDFELSTCPQMQRCTSLHISWGWVREWVDGRVIFRSTERRNVETFRGKRAKKRASSGSLSSPQAQPKKPVQNGFAITAFPRWDARLGAGPTREICRLGRYRPIKKPPSGGFFIGHMMKITYLFSAARYRQNR